jgi:hypothetical protein
MVRNEAQREPVHRQMRLAGKPAQPDGMPVGSAEAGDAARLMRCLAIAIRKDDGSYVLEEVALLLERPAGYLMFIAR